MITILFDVEAVINSRPLNYMSEDPFDLELLKPSFIIQDIKTVGVPNINNLDKINLTKRWRYYQRLREQFRQSFRDEYLGPLAQRPLKRKFVRPIKINDIVLVGQDNLKRSYWLIDRVIDIYPRKDNQVRVEKLKSKAGELTRPGKKKCILLNFLHLLKLN
ncbi:DUF5641 domain-containing protein [Nephila pilipes]|uniref:DUF5641 domain-containing protein n=1 Tax=Nephila pilipes TaxID=299642 RepID=A0A8X6PGC6_NEPPI|nr:DUF5641 domain-containing protein [Nephila pilipes]